MICDFLRFVFVNSRLVFLFLLNIFPKLQKTRCWCLTFSYAVNFLSNFVTFFYISGTCVRSIAIFFLLPNTKIRSNMFIKPGQFVDKLTF